MKRIFAVIMITVAVMQCATPASASKIGDVVNHTVYTDIIASINDYNIASYNIDGYTAVVAEDLENYGFNVQWSPEERALYITRDLFNIWVKSTYIAPEISKGLVGKRSADVLYTDIKTYINGELVTSYNISGKTIIYFDDLAVFGEVSYSDTARRLDLDIEGLNYKISPPEPYSSFFPSGLYFEENSADGIQVRWTARNNSNKTINYYTTEYVMFNAVGDLAYDRWGNPDFTIKTIGPVYPGEWIINFTGKYKAEVYDAPCAYLLLHTIVLEYSDGTSETIYYDHIGKESY